MTCPRPRLRRLTPLAASLALLATTLTPTACASAGSSSGPSAGATASDTTESSTAVPAQQDPKKVLASLSTAEKAGQLMMVWSLSSANDAQREKLRKAIADAGLGGVILSLGSAAEAAEMTALCQEGAKVPLFVAGDFEAGLGFRLTDTADFGNNMLIGATGLTRLSEAAGAATGAEARALGFHWNFAPVADVNINPANPIINVRSFGEDPEMVSRFTAAFIRGNESAAVISTAKHFPGHGDVTSDSHLTMPTVPGDRARLEKVELPPFEAAIEAGVGSIMTGHLSVPGLGEDEGVPATLSKRILTGLLRKKLGFEGLVVTDALDMGGVREKIKPIDAAKRALVAGADVLLMPPDPVATRDAIVAAVESGEISRRRLDEAVLRILRAKARTGLLDRTRVGPDPEWRTKVDTAAHRALADEIARRGLTLVRDEAGLIPIARDVESSRAFVAVVDKVDDRCKALAAQLAERGFETFHLHPESSAEDVARAAAALRTAAQPIAAFAIKVKSYSGTIGIPPLFAPVVEAIDATAARAITISLGNPYLIRDFASASTYLCAYTATPHTERAVGAALFGEAAITGRLPVRIPDIAPAGAGITRMRKTGAALPAVTPAAEGFAPDLADRVRALCEKAIAEGAFPGASAIVTRRGNVVAQVAVGRATYDADSAPITPDTVYDLASLTKVCATGPTVLRLIADGKLALDQKVSDLVPAFGEGEDERRDEVTIHHLLTHSAGLPAYIRFFREMEGKATIVEASARTPLQSSPGAKYKYSDLGLILLMACVEAATDEPFDVVAQREVFDPLGMKSATFVARGASIDAPPTEEDPFRGHLVRGEVHDENAWAMGGVSGHAGLFANAADVARLGNAFLGGGCGWLPAPLALQATTRAELVPGSSRGLGWDTYTARGSAGSKFSERSFGHTGFTGTSIWCDPETDVCVVLLTNRVHPTRDNKKVFKVRRALADLVHDALGS